MSEGRGGGREGGRARERAQNLTRITGEYIICLINDNSKCGNIVTYIYIIVIPLSYGK